MADVVFVKNETQNGTTHISWGPLTNTDTQGTPISISGAADKSVQISGTPGTATIVIEGSNDLTSPSNFQTLTDPQGNAISKTAAAIEAIMENTLWIRPRVTGANGSTSITVQLLTKR